MDSEETKEKAPIPKFASFKPKPSPVSAPDEHRRSRGYHDDETGKRSKDGETLGGIPNAPRHRDHDRHRKRSRDRHHSRKSHRSRERRVSKIEDPAAVQGIVPQEPDVSLYKVDKLGDRNILVYGSLHRWDVPLYRRAGSGRVLGLPLNYRIDRDSEYAKSLIVRPHMWTVDSAKLKSKNAFWRLAGKEKRFHRVRPESRSGPESDLQRDFLPIDLHGSSKRRRIRDRASAVEWMHPSDEYDRDYRSIEGKAQANLDSDVNSETDSDSDHEGSRKRNADLSKRVSESSDDVDAWLQLIDHQEHLVGRADSDGHRILTAAERRSVADIKISLYDKALRNIPAYGARDRLLLGMMEEGSKIWDSKTLSTKWKDILRSNPGYISLWVKYLNFQQTQFLSFTYEQCKSFFVECLKLNLQRDDSRKRHVINIYVLLRLSLFMREAGFMEHAVALWQTVLEFNFCRPESINIASVCDSAASSFAEFWESEVARIGEPGAKGWGNPANEPIPPKSDPQPEDDIDDRAIFESWIRQEQTCACGSRLPARTLDEVREDDPYRVILFSDIADFLIPFAEHGLSELLVNSFLVFCRLPPLLSHNDTQIFSQWRGDPFLCNNVLDQLTKQISNWFSDTLQEPGVGQNHPMKFSPQNFAVTADTLFHGDEYWFSALESWKITYSRDNAPIDNQWVRQTLQLLVDRWPSYDELAEYSVALEFACNPKEAKKYAKGLLRKRPSSVKLYNAYSLIEARNGRFSAAEQIWATTLTMNQNFGNESKVNCIILWRSWVWEALQNNQKERAMRLLLSIPSQHLDRDEFLQSLDMDPPHSTAEFLKARRFLGEVQDHGLTFRKIDTFVDSTECHALLVYLSQDRDVEKALCVYKTAESHLKDQKYDYTTTLELLYQAMTKLLYYHARSSRLYQPVLTRAELIQSISCFPHNTIFLAVFAWNETRFRIADRVRSVLRQHTLTNGRDDSTDYLTSSNLIPHLFSVYTELHRGVSAGSTVHSARAAFETTVTSDSGQSSAAAWKLYVLFELTFGEKSQAKDVFYRSMRACPWAKELVLLAFREDGLRKHMELDELRKVWNVLVEKELRIHVDLEEWFEENEHKLSVSGMGEGLSRPVVMPDNGSDDGAMDEG